MVIFDNFLSEGSRGKKGQELGVVLKGEMVTIGVRRVWLLRRWPVEMRLRIEGAPELLIISVIRSCLFSLIILSISSCVLIKIFCISVFEEFIMCGLIES